MKNILFFIDYLHQVMVFYSLHSLINHESGEIVMLLFVSSQLPIVVQLLRIDCPTV